MAKHRANINVHSLAAEYFAAHYPLTYVNKKTNGKHVSYDYSLMLEHTAHYTHFISLRGVNAKELLTK